MAVELAPADASLIDAFAAHLTLERRLSPHTVTAYRSDLRGLATFLERDRASLADATYPLLRRYLAQQHTRGYARASIARRVGAIRTFYRWAAEDARVPTDPSVLLGSPKVVSRLPTVLRAREAAALAESPASTEAVGVDGPIPTPLQRAVLMRDRALLELLYGSGLRVGEVAGLTLDRVDLDRGRVLVRGKGDKEREVPMSDLTVDALEAYLSLARPVMAGPDRTHLFYNLRKRRMTDRDMRTMVGRYAERLLPGRRVSPAHPAPFVRHPHARRRRGHPSGTGTTGSRQRCHHAALYARLPDPALRGLRAFPPEGLTWRRRRSPR